MVYLTLLLTQVCSASQSSTFSFHTKSADTGNSEKSLFDAFLIEITSQLVHTLAFDLEAVQGDPDLYVTTEVNKRGGEWRAVAVGSDYLEVKSTDDQLKGLGLQRQFGVYISRDSTQGFEYTLTITALGASDWKAASEASLNPPIAAFSKTVLLTVKEGDLPEPMEAKKGGNNETDDFISGVVLWVVSELLRGNVFPALVLLALVALCCWPKCKRRRTENQELAARLT